MSSLILHSAPLMFLIKPFGTFDVHWDAWNVSKRMTADLKGIPWTGWPRSNNVFSHKHIKAASDYTTLIWDQTRASSYFSTVWSNCCILNCICNGKITSCLKKKKKKHNPGGLCLRSGLVIFTYKDETCACLCPADGHHFRHRGKTTQTPLSIERRRHGWVPVGTEEEERRLSNSEKSSLDVPLDALNRSKLPGRG